MGAESMISQIPYWPHMTLHTIMCLTIVMRYGHHMAQTVMSDRVFGSTRHETPRPCTQKTRHVFEVFSWEGPTVRTSCVCSFALVFVFILSFLLVFSFSFRFGLFFMLCFIFCYWRICFFASYVWAMLYIDLVSLIGKNSMLGCLRKREKRDCIRDTNKGKWETTYKPAESPFIFISSSRHFLSSLNELIIIKR